jgi:hypothetical protein
MIGEKEDNRMDSEAKTSKPDQSIAQLEKQIATVMEAIKKNPSKKKQILIGYISHFYEGVKETIRKFGSVMPHYMILADTPKFGGPAVVQEVIEEAKALKAEAILSVEGFEAENDMTDVVYHVAMTTPSMGAMGWVFKVRLGDKKADILAEKPYLFESENDAKTLGEMVEELEAIIEKAR